MIELLTIFRFTGGIGGKALRSSGMQIMYTMILQRMYDGFTKKLKEAKEKGEEPIENYYVIFTDEGCGLEVHLFSQDRAYLEKEKKVVEAMMNSWKTRVQLKMAGVSAKSEIVEG